MKTLNVSKLKIKSFNLIVFIMQTQIDNTENNILIASFLGWDIFSDGNYQFEGEVTRTLPDFENDWNALIQAVEAIENYLPDDSSVIIEYNSCFIPIYEAGFDIYITYDTKIQSVYNAVIEFAKWYNETKTK